MLRRIVSGVTLILLVLSIKSFQSSLQLVDMKFGSTLLEDASTREVLVRENYANAGSSSIIVNGTDTLTLADGTFRLNETVIVEDSGTLIIENATVVFTTESYTVIQSYDNGTVRIEDSVIERGLWYYVYFHDSSNVSISNSRIKYMGCYGTANIMVNSSVVSTVNNHDSVFFTLHNSSVFTLSSYESPQVVISDSVVYAIGVLRSSDYTISDSTIDDIDLSFGWNSNVTLVSLPTGFVVRWGLYKNNTVNNAYVNLTLSNTSLDRWWITARDDSVVSLIGITTGTLYTGEHSIVSITNSNVGDLWALDYSTIYVYDSIISSLEIDTDLFPTVHLINSTYSILSWIISIIGGGNPKIYMAWYLDSLVMDSRNLSLPNMPVEVYWKNGTLLNASYTDSDGWASFILYEKRIEYFYGIKTFHYRNYTVEARYGTITNETLIESINTNSKINITLPAISGDVKPDGIVDIQDLISITLSYGLRSEDWFWNPYADQNCDDVINFHDFMVVIANMIQEDKEKIGDLAWHKTNRICIPE